MVNARGNHWNSEERTMRLPKSIVTLGIALSGMMFALSAYSASYTIFFHANGGTGSMGAMTVSRDAGVALAPEAFSREGHAFAGWAKSENGTLVYENMATVINLAPAGGSVDLYALWTPLVITPSAPTTYTVKFNANGGKLPKGKKMSKQTFTYGKAAKLRRNTFTRAGYVFLGWSKTKAGPVKYKNAQSVKNVTAAGKSVTLYAAWAKKIYAIAFYANGGKGEMAVQFFTYGKAKKLSANKFSRSGYTFKGWAKSKALARNGEVAYKNRKIVKNLVKNGKTVKLYAVWKKKASTISGTWTGTATTSQVHAELYLDDSNGDISGTLALPDNDIRSVWGYRDGSFVELYFSNGDVWYLTRSGNSMVGTGDKYGTTRTYKLSFSKR